MNVFVLSLIITAFSLNDLIPIFKNRQWYVLIAYAAIMTVLIGLAVLISLNVDIPSPAVLISKWVTFIFGVHQEQ